MMMMQQRLILPLLSIVLLAVFLYTTSPNLVRFGRRRILDDGYNDVCESSEAVAIGSTFFVNTSFANRDDPVDDCIEEIVPTEFVGVWFSFVGNGERLFARACRFFDGYAAMSVYTGNCSNLQCVAGKLGLCSADRFQFDTIANTTYRVLVQASGRNFDLSLNVAPPPVVNDRCANASPIAIGSTVPVNLTFATPDAINYNCTGDSFFDDSYPGVWYSLVGTGERVVVQSCNIYYTTITVLEGDCNATSLKCVVSTNTPCSLTGANFETVPGTTYYILLRSSQSSTDDANAVELSILLGGLAENDSCEDAQLMTIGSTVRANFLYATREEGFGYDSAFDNCLPGTQSYGVPGLWYTFVGNGKQLATRMGPFCNSFDSTAIAIFVRGCNATSLRCVVGTGNLCRRDRLLFRSIKGTVYHVLIRSASNAKNVPLTVATCGLFQLGLFCPPTLAEILGFVNF